MSAASLKITAPASPSLMFGSTEVGKESAAMAIEVTNSGASASGALSVTVTGDFKATGCSGTLNGGQKCTLMVVFAPTAAGTRSGSVTVTATPGGSVMASLTGAAITMPTVVVAPTSNDFGNVPVDGMSSTPFVVNINNTGGAATPLTVAVSGEFTMMNKCGMTLNGGAMCTVDVNFAPKSAGTKTGALTIAAGGQVFTVTLRGVGQAGAKLEAAPQMAELVGEVGSQGTPVTVTVLNAGDIRAQGITAALSGANAGEFVVADNNCTSLNADATCQVRVALKATSAGAKMATLTISGMPGGSVMVSLRGTAFAPPDLAIAPASGDFATVVVGGTSAMPVTFTVTNNGGVATGALRATSSSVEFRIVTNTCENATIAPMGTCSVQLVFAPTSAGPKTASLTVIGTPGGTKAVSLTGTGLPPAGLSIAPPTGNFGTVDVNTESTDIEFTVTNGGGTETAALVTTIVDSTQFKITGNACNGTLAAGANCKINVRFAPTVAMNANGKLVVTAGALRAESSLLGTGRTGPALSLDDTNHPFGSVVEGFASADKVFTLRNTGMSRTGMLAIATGGTNRTDFEFTNGCPATLDMGESCLVTVRFKPAVGSLGARFGSLIVSATGITTSATLTGTGLAQIELNPTSLSFPPTVLGKTSNLQVEVRVRAPFMALTQLVSAGGDNFSITACNPGTLTNPSTTGIPCDATVTFAPLVSQAKGGKMGTVTVTGDSYSVQLPLSGEGTGALQITPKDDSRNFGDKVVNQMPWAKKTFRVTNNGLVAVSNVTAVKSGGAEFVEIMNGCANASLAPAEFCEIVVEFRPTVVASASGTINVTGMSANGPEADSVQFSGAGVLTPAPTISVAGNANYGDVALTDTKEVTFTVSNAAGAATTGDLTVTVGGTNYSLSNNGCVGADRALPAGGSCMFKVAFTPPAGGGLGERTGTITVRDSTGPAGTVTVDLTANVIQSLTVSPEVWSFGNGVTNANGDRDTTGGPVQDFVFTNGGAAATLTAAIVAGTAPDPDTDDFTIISNDCANVAAKGTCTIRVRFIPNEVGASTALLTLTGAGSIARSVALSGTGIKDAILSWVNVPAAADRDFGSIRVGQTSSQITFTLRNAGDVAATALTKPASIAPFFIQDEVAGNCFVATPLGPGETCNVVVDYRPTTTEGPDSKALAVTATGRLTNITVSPTITLKGQGITGMTPFAVYISPSPANLGEVFAGENGATTMFTVTNPTGSAVTVPMGALTVTGPFAIDADNCSGQMLALAGGTCTFTARLAPGMGEAPGMKNGTISLNVAGTPVVGVYGRVKTNAILTVTEPSGGGDFGKVVTPETPEREWTITNTGEKASGALVTTAPTAGEFEIVNNTCNGAMLGVTAPSNACVIRVRFIRGSVGTTASSFGLNGPDVTTPVNVALAGHRVVAASINVNATSPLSFGTVRVGTSTPSSDIEVRNGTDANVQTTGGITVEIIGTNANQFSVVGCEDEKTAGLVANATCNNDVVVTYSPKTVGSHTAELRISGSPGGTKSITLTGTSAPSVEINPATQPFAGTNAEHTFAITIEPGANPTATGPLSTGVSSGFQITANTCQGVVLGPGGVPACSITVRFVGTSATMGTLTVTDTAVAGNSDVAELNGTIP